MSLQDDLYQCPESERANPNRGAVPLNRYGDEIHDSLACTCSGPEGGVHEDYCARSVAAWRKASSAARGAHARVPGV